LTTPDKSVPAAREAKDKRGLPRTWPQGPEDMNEKPQEPVWPRRPSATEKPPEAKGAKPEEPEQPKGSPKSGFALPPPGTVTKKDVEPTVEKAPPADAAADGSDEDRVHEVSPLEHRFVGLVIGKAGDTIKSFKKQSGASIEIDQNLPDGMPRVVIYRGTKKQVASAKKLVDGLVQRAKEDEKNKIGGGPPIGMGIMGRGEGGKPGADGAPLPSPTASSKVDGGADAKSAASSKVDDAAGAAKAGELPPWRRGKPGEEELGPRKTPGTAPRRDLPWTKQKENEAAPSGSLTGSLTGALSGGLAPAWMKRSKSTGETTHEESEMLGPFARSVWSESKYSRGLLLQAKLKILRGKAYEVPEEMMTMTTGERPKWKAEKREKDGVDGKDEDEHDTPRGEKTTPKLHFSSEPACASPGASGGKDAAEEEPAAAGAESTTPVTKKVQKAPTQTPGGIYENLPGDSKDIMKLKKKLREIQKIEASIEEGEAVEPNQKEKVTKKAAYIEELRLLESIVRSPVAGGGGAGNNATGGS
jgi:hypothetical protein